MCNIVFVILHYEDLNDTKKCISSLLRYLDNNQIQIVVVDNGSRTNKLNSISNLYEEINQVHFLYSKENLGFARGNNIGFLFAKKTLEADVIVLTNNDIIFKQDNFIKLLIEKYKEGFDIAGPKIISMTDMKNQNPVPVLYRNVEDVKKRIIKFEILLFLSWFNFDLRLKKVLNKRKRKNESTQNDFQLHGACMFFAHRYLKEYDGLYDKTFMYGEESILKYIVDYNKMHMSYYEDMEVYHKEGSSTKKTWGKGRRSRQFFYKWNIVSCQLLEEMMSKHLK